MEIFSALLAICAGNAPVADEIPAKRPMTRSFDFFIWVWINGCVNNLKAGDLRRYRAAIVTQWRHCNGLIDSKSSLAPMHLAELLMTLA